jgi:hypothetical protein
MKKPLKAIVEYPRYFSYSGEEDKATILDN